MTANPTIVAAPRDADALIESLHGTPRVAIDTEFHAERRFLPELYLVQIQVDGGPTWIVDPFHQELILQIAPALKSVPWVVHAGEQDLRVLEVALGGLTTEVSDTQIAAGLVTPDWPASYASLVERYVGEVLEKGETLSDWSRRPLSPAQLAYAAADVKLLLPLWDALAQDLDRLGRTELARRAFAESLRVAGAPPDDSDAFRTLPAAPALQPAQLLVLQELSSWRNERARATNQPVRTVLSDGVLVDLARRQPATVAALLANRRLPRSIARDAEDLVERIARARQRPEWAVPKVLRKRTPEWRAAQWIQLWADVVGEETRFAGSLALPRPLVERIVLEAHGDRDVLRALLGWRDDLIGEDLHRVLNGAVALSFDGRDVLRGAR